MPALEHWSCWSLGWAEKKIWKVIFSVAIEKKLLGCFCGGCCCCYTFVETHREWLSPPLSPSQFSAISLYFTSICKDIYGMIVELRNGTELLGKCSSFTKYLQRHKIINFWYKSSCCLIADGFFFLVLITCLDVYRLFITQLLNCLVLWHFKI